jgi:thymidylate synthase
VRSETIGEKWERPTTPEAVNHPAHYNPGPYEAYKVIEEYGLGFHLGNVIKYILRADKKGNTIEDLKKAQWYPKPRDRKIGGTMNEYLRGLAYVMAHGVWKQNRTGVDTKGVFGYQMRFDLAEGFPLLTTKKMFFPGIVHELLWFISGSTNVGYLQQNRVHIWDAWADEEGELGPVYGKQWRRWDDKTGGSYIDQLQSAIEQIKAHPESRRIVISAWNPSDVPRMKLPPCHMIYQFLVEPVADYDPNPRLSCHMNMRSADIFLGVPFNIASYALLTMMVAAVCELEPGNLILSFGDLHLYENHLDQAREQLTRAPYPQPRVQINLAVNNIDGFTFEDVQLLGYENHPAIRADVAV